MPIKLEEVFYLPDQPYHPRKIQFLSQSFGKTTVTCQLIMKSNVSASWTAQIVAWWPYHIRHGVQKLCTLSEKRVLEIVPIVLRSCDCGSCALNSIVILLSSCHCNLQLSGNWTSLKMRVLGRPTVVFTVVGVNHQTLQVTFTLLLTPYAYMYI